MNATKELFLTNRKAVREAFGKSDQDVLRDVVIIGDWIKTQPHLPEIPSCNMIEVFLTTNKFSIERTKQKLDMYYTIRSLIPEIYDHSNPLLPPMVDFCGKTGICVSLPRQTKELYRVFVMKIIGPPEDFDAYKFLTYIFNIMEMKIQHDSAVGDVFVIDHQKLKMGHVVKVTPVHLTKGSAVLEKVFSNRVKGIHIVNWAPFVDVLLNIIKAIFKPKLFSRIKLHSSLKELYEYVPREVLPRDYGGDERSLEELNELGKKMFRENAERFNKLDQMRVKEDLRPTPLENDEILGYHGNFKKLDVD